MDLKNECLDHGNTLQVGLNNVVLKISPQLRSLLDLLRFRLCVFVCVFCYRENMFHNSPAFMSSTSLLCLKSRKLKFPEKISVEYDVLDFWEGKKKRH